MIPSWRECNQVVKQHDDATTHLFKVEKLIDTSICDRCQLLTESKMVLKFCANLSFMFTESSNLLERYQLASDLGFQAVECAFPYEYSLTDVIQAKTKANVQQILINCYPGMDFLNAHFPLHGKNMPKLFDNR